MDIYCGLNIPKNIAKNYTRYNQTGLFNVLQVILPSNMEEQMMSEFMVDVNLRGVHSDDFLRLIPGQRNVVNELMLEGKITSYCVSMDRSKLWMTMVGKDEEEIMEVLSRFPLIKFMDCEISPLLFYNNAFRAFSHISLN